MQEKRQQEQQNEVPSSWVFNPGAAPQPSNGSSTQASPATPPENVITWSASEYIGNPKSMTWFAMLAAAAVAVAVIVYFITSDYVSTVVIIVLGIIVGVFAARQPNVLQYSLDRAGIHMGLRFYPYNSFKSFSVVDDGAFSHISLLPLKRFMPNMAIHYAPTDEEKITKTLADYLPYEEHQGDVIENFSRRVRF
jgi:hypothetical protein